MKILLISASTYMSPRFSDMIFAPRDLAISLADGLIKGGHEVIFATSPDTKTTARIFPGDPKMLDLILQTIDRPTLPPLSHTRVLSAMKRDWEIDLITRALSFANTAKVDIIHSYHKDMIHYFETFVENIPFVYTIHDPVPESGSLAYLLFSKFKAHKFISISQSQQQSQDLSLNFVGNVYHGISLANFPFSETPDDALLFMGRLIKEKGLHSAMAVAMKTNTKLIVGAEFPSEKDETAYFREQIKPHLGSHLIVAAGMKGNIQKTSLYAKAKALLFPIEWQEPFGMVMIEAMACGTPVIAYNRGSVPEIVKDGVTGFIVDPDQGVDGLARAVGKIDQIDRAACRAHVEEHFTVEKMVEGYEEVYEKYGKYGE